MFKSCSKCCDNTGSLLPTEDRGTAEMSLHNGTAAETERKRMLEAEGHIILNLGQNQYGDLEDVCHDVIIEVKTSKNGRRDLSKKEKMQMANLHTVHIFQTFAFLFLSNSLKISSS